MQSPHNMWQRVWQQAKPVPAWQQKRLFDDTHESLQVLHYLETRTIAEIYELTIVPTLHAAVLKFKDMANSCQVLDLFEAKIDTVLAEICRMSRDIEIVSQIESGASIIRTPSPESIISQLESLEPNFYQFKCLENMTGYPLNIKLDQLKAYFQEISVSGGTLEIRKQHNDKLEHSYEPSIGRLLSAENIENELLDKLISKEYVLRVDGETNGRIRGQGGPQFMRAIVTGAKLRLCGAFTDSTTFI